MEGPSKILLSAELIRAIYEYGLGWMLTVPLQFISPKGDGHPVIILPGLGANDGSTHYLRSFLSKQGYSPQTWDLGRNLGPRNGLEHMLAQLRKRIVEISKAHNNSEVSIIGWSLGGVYGREVAKICPEIVRQVITLGSPFKPAGGTNAGRVYEILSKDRSHKDPEIIHRISQGPPVPFTSLYSKTDGVVHWSASIEDIGPFYENIEVPGASHLGLGHNPISVFLIANRLANTKLAWTPYSSK